MANMSNLPRDLAEEVLCRIPLKSMRAVRSTCKKWNTLLSKDKSFAKKHLGRVAKEREGEFPAIVLINFSVYLMSVNLHGGIQSNSDPSVKPTGKLISLDDSGKVEICRVCHCEGLLLCTTRDYTRLVVWNPYTGQTRWICVEPKSVDHRVVWYGHALGYDKSKSFKILRYALLSGRHGRPVHEIYELNSNSWRVLDVTQDWKIDHNDYGLSLNGNTYWFAYDRNYSRGAVPDFLLCFDFKREKFGPRLPLPFRSYNHDAVLLSSVREEQLAVLFQRWDTYVMEIWVTTKIEPNAVLWSNLFKVDMEPVTHFRYYNGGSFMVDEERRAVVVIDQDQYAEFPTRHTAYIIAENGYYEEVDLVEITGIEEKEREREEGSFPLACSYVPSLVQINLPA